MPTEGRALSPGRVARWLGAVIAVVAAGVIAWRVIALAGQLAPLLSGPGLLAATLGCSLIYGLSLFLLATAWSMLARAGVTRASATLRALVGAYGTSSVAKYLPGNVFHFAGRQLLGARLGLAQSSLAVASLLEATLSVVAALGLAGLAIALTGRARPELLDAIPSLVWYGGGAALALVGWFATRSMAKGTGTAPRSLPTPTTLAAAATLTLAFFATSGLAAAFLQARLAAGPQPVAFVAASYLISWVAGFVVPGAPGGIGIREAVLVALLGPVAGEESAVALALVMRAVTTLGDAVFAALCFRFVARPGRIEPGGERIDSR